MKTTEARKLIREVAQGAPANKLVERTLSEDENWSGTIRGNGVRIRYKEHPRHLILIEELPTKPNKRKLRRVEVYLASLQQLSQSYGSLWDAFMVENILRGWKLPNNFTFDQAVASLKAELEAVKDKIIKAGIQGYRGKPIDDSFFDDYYGFGKLLHAQEVDFLLVEPDDYKPIVIVAKDFKVSAAWAEWKAYSPGSDLTLDDPHYTMYRSSSPRSARALYKLGKFNPDVLKDVTWDKFDQWLQANKIDHKMNFSVWH